MYIKEKFDYDPLETVNRMIGYVGAMEDLQEQTRVDSMGTNFAVPSLTISPGSRLDAMSAGQLQEQLTYYHPEILRQEFQEYKYANGLVPIDPQEYIGVQKISRTRVTRTGQWRRSSDATTPLSPIDIGITDVEYGKVPFDGLMTFTPEELDVIERSQRMNDIRPTINTIQEKVTAVQQSFQQLVNRIMAFGDPRSGIYGLHNHPGLIKVRSPFRMGRTTTSDNNIAILTEMAEIVDRNSRERSSFNTLLMPKRLGRQLSAQIRSTSASISTLGYYLDTPMLGRGIAIASAVEMESAGPGNTPAIQGYRMDRSRIVGCIPKRMRQAAPPSYRDGKYRVEFKCELGGVHMLRPYDHVMLYDVLEAA